MHADLDALCTFVYCTADDLLPEERSNARRRTTDAEIVTLAVAQAIMGEPSDRRFLRRAKNSLVHLFPLIPGQAGYFKRRRRLAPYLSWLLVIFAEQSPGFSDDLLLIDSTPVECGRSRETTLRSALADVCDYGYCASHSRYFWGVRLHALCAPDGTPRALELAAPSRDEREVGLALLAPRRRAAHLRQGLRRTRVRGRRGRPRRHGGAPLAQGRARPRPSPGAHPPAQRVDRLDLQGPAHPGAPRARTIAGLLERVLQRFLCLAACISLHHRLRRPSRALVDYCA